VISFLDLLVDEANAYSSVERQSDLASSTATSSNSHQAAQSISAAEPASLSAVGQEDNGCLFAGYKRRRIASASPAGLQEEQYLDVCDDEAEVETTDCLQFWAAKRLRFPLLYQLALRSLSAPASSAPIERVFSHGGILMRPHRTSLSDETLCRLIF
jgi:hypothetical protein